MCSWVAFRVKRRIIQLPVISWLESRYSSSVSPVVAGRVSNAHPVPVNMIEWIVFECTNDPSMCCSY